MGSQNAWGADQYRILAEEAISVVLANRAQIFKRKELAPWTGKGSNIHKKMAHIVEVWKKDFGVGEGGEGGAVKAEGADTNRVSKHDEKKKKAAAGKSARRTKKEEHSDDDLSWVGDDKSNVKDEHSLASSEDKNGTNNNSSSSSSSSSSSNKLGLRPQRKTTTKPTYFEDAVGSDDDEGEGETDDVKREVDQREGNKEAEDKVDEDSSKETVKAATGSKRKAAGRVAKSAPSKRSKA